MSKQTTVILYVLISIACLALLIFGFFHIPKQITEFTSSESWKDFDNLISSDSFFNVKTLRDATITYCTFAIGLFAIIFEVGKKDRFGNSIKQENHFELIYLEKRVLSMGIKPDCSNGAIIWLRKLWGKTKTTNKKKVMGVFLIPYPIYLGVVIGSAIIGIFGNKSEFAICTMYVVFVSAMAFLGVYMVKVLYIMYSHDWITEKVKIICRKALITQDDSENTGEVNQNLLKNRLMISSRAIRILAESGTPCSEDITDMLRDNKLKKHLEVSDNCLNEVIRFFESAIVACYYSGAGTCDNSQLTDSIFSSFIGLSCEKYYLFMIACVDACRELKELVDNKKHKIVGKLVHEHDRAELRECILCLRKKTRDTFYVKHEDENNEIPEYPIDLVTELYEKYVNRNDSYAANVTTISEEEDKNIRETAESYFRDTYINEKQAGAKRCIKIR